jgi:hypothetical protein
MKPDRLVPLDDTIRKLALQVTEGKKTDLEKARAIYDYVEKTMAYDKSGTGWGNGDIYWACDAKRGNCTDFHALFIGLNRAVGIPAKFEIGFPIPGDRGQGEIGGYHCWADGKPFDKVAKTFSYKEEGAGKAGRYRGTVLAGAACPPKPHPRSLSTSGEGGPRDRNLPNPASWFRLRSPSPRSGEGARG